MEVGSAPPRSTAHMIYQAYQAYADLAVPVRTMASLGALMLRVPLFGPLTPPWGSWLAAALEIVARTGLTHQRPAYGIDRIRVGDGDVAVREETIRASCSSPFSCR
jgi:poly(3-hydroxybutyrate) depolymerase